MATTEATSISTVQAEKICFSHEDLVKEWSFPLKPLHDFERGGRTAQYAPGHPKQWGDDTHYLDFQYAIRNGQPESAYENYYAAISPDDKLLAITSTHERILLYDIESKELRQVVDGAGYLIFAPSRQKIETKIADGQNAEPQTPAYVLVCSSSDEVNRTGEGNQLVAWEFDEQGRLLDQEETIDASALATQAVDAILSDLTRKHEWSTDFIKASSLHADFAKALEDVATTHRRRHNTIFDDAELGGFGSTSFSNDGRMFLYHTQNKSTQSGMRDAKDLPCVIVMDLVNDKELHRLSGHTDAIMWSAISPDREHIASVAWDGTLRMYSSSTGGLEWAIIGEGQAWTGAFSADSKHIVWTTGNGKIVSVHDVHDGQGRASFPEGFDFRNWCRRVTWHPDGQQIALCTGKHAYVWRPFDDAHGAVTQHYQIEDDREWGWTSVEDVNWLDNGRLLHLHFSDGTNMVYNTQRNVEELFMHPKGVRSVWVYNGFHSNIKVAGIQNGYASVDGDGKVRYWSPGIGPQGSWWEAAQEQDGQGASSTRQVPFPETGKYVMVTRQPEKGNTKQKNEPVGGT